MILFFFFLLLLLLLLVVSRSLIVVEVFVFSWLLFSLLLQSRVFCFVSTSAIVGKGNSAMSIFFLLVRISLHAHHYASSSPQSPRRRLLFFFFFHLLPPLTVISGQSLATWEALELWMSNDPRWREFRRFGCNHVGNGGPVLGGGMRREGGNFFPFFLNT